ncbi:hypothetical protein [Rosistilla ulvae]|uniref:hypothetical protein n=1 Tax=Rosistilla ulvae TaxID=1930277 RepID=UPI001FE5B064|nr:hypothetical protein [Rosistilla ulvae]
MDRSDVGIQFVTANLQAFADAEPIVLADSTIVLPSRVQLPKKLASLGLVAVQFETAITKTVFLQSPVNNVQRSRLFRHKQNCFSHGQTLRNNVGNRLTFARPWRPDQNKILPF